LLVLHKRWGQKAPDSAFSSYTEEEFHRAYERWRTTGAPAIFVLYKRVDPETEADPGPQLQKVMAFRAQLEESRQLITRYFSDRASFAREVSSHLRAYAKGDLPKADVVDVPMLPLHAIEAVRMAREEARAAEQAAAAAHQRAEQEAARASELALAMAESAAEAAREGKPEKARQRFANAVAGTTNVHILSLAFEFYFPPKRLFNAGQRRVLLIQALMLRRVAVLGTSIVGGENWKRLRGGIRSSDLSTSKWATERASQSLAATSEPYA
jgi:hypothetical protein